MPAASIPQLRALYRARPDALTQALLLDRLTERGDPRSLFAHAHAVGDRGLVEALLARYAAHLKDPLPADAEVDFDGGFVCAWRTTPTGFRAAGRRLLRVLPVRALTVTDARPVDVKYVLTSWGLETVSALSFPRVAARVLFAALERDAPAEAPEVHFTSLVPVERLGELPAAWQATAQRVPGRPLRGVEGRVPLVNLGYRPPGDVASRLRPDPVFR
jgi:hypothetical protein